MTPNEETPPEDVERVGPGAWIGLGLLVIVIGAIVTAGTGDSGWVVIAAVPGGVMLWIGVIAKGVQVGIRSTRD